MMTIILTYALPIAFIVSFAIYTKYQLIDEDDGPGWTFSETMWHRSGLAMRIIVFAIGLAWGYLPAPLEKYVLHSAAICATLFDIILNILRGKPILYYGAGGSDGRFKNLKWAILFGTVLVTTIFVIK